MSTRSHIIVQLSDTTWTRIYCHCDGYLEHNGQILQRHYATQELAAAVVAPGDMSYLQPNCTKPVGHSYDKPVDGYCIYYGRDRGEKDTLGINGPTLDSVWPSPDEAEQFTYVWNDGAWRYCKQPYPTTADNFTPAILEPLQPALATLSRRPK